MRSTRIKAFMAATLTALLSSPAAAQVTVYDWIATDDVANWNEQANWDSLFGNAVPNAGAFDGESALINNGGTATVAEAVPKIAGLEVRNGTVDIAAGGVLETIADDVNSGTLAVGAAGAIHLSENGELTVGGDATNAGTIGLTGASAALRVGGDFATSGALFAGISGNAHSAIQVDGVATLGGILQVDAGDAAPEFGQSWDLIKASTVSGRFSSVDAAGSTALPRGLQYQVTSDGTTASLQVGNALVATVDRQTGAGVIENVVGGAVGITGYALRSDNGLLTTNWNGVLGDGWTTANPTQNHVAELSLSGVRTLDVGTKIELGTAYAGGPASPDEEDLVFQYATADGSLREGIVEYTGALNDIVLHVDPANGMAAIANLSQFIEAPDLTSYAVRSASGGLAVDTWTTLTSTGEAGEGWSVANPTSNHIAELNLQSSKPVTNGTLLSLGQIFASEAQRDLIFEYTTTAGELLRGTVQYGSIPTVGTLPGDCNRDGVVNGLDLECIIAAGGADALNALLGELDLVPGDLNANGTVDFDDFVVISNNFNQSVGSYPEGDIDANGLVDFDDFIALSNNFGKTAAAASVPEPTCCTGLIIVASIVTVRLRRRRTT